MVATARGQQSTPCVPNVFSFSTCPFISNLPGRPGVYLTLEVYSSPLFILKQGVLFTTFEKHVVLRGQFPVNHSTSPSKSRQSAQTLTKPRALLPWLCRTWPWQWHHSGSECYWCHISLFWGITEIMFNESMQAGSRFIFIFKETRGKAKTGGWIKPEFAIIILVTPTPERDPMMRAQVIIAFKTGNNFLQIGCKRVGHKN